MSPSPTSVRSPFSFPSTTLPRRFTGVTMLAVGTEVQPAGAHAVGLDDRARFDQFVGVQRDQLLPGFDVTDRDEPLAVRVRRLVHHLERRGGKARHRPRGRRRGCHRHEAGGKAEPQSEAPEGAFHQGNLVFPCGVRSAAIERPAPVGADHKVATSPKTGPSSASVPPATPDPTTSTRTARAPTRLRGGSTTSILPGSGRLRGRREPAVRPESGGGSGALVDPKRLGHRLVWVVYAGDAEGELVDGGLAGVAFLPDREVGLRRSKGRGRPCDQVRILTRWQRDVDGVLHAKQPTPAPRSPR